MDKAKYLTKVEADLLFTKIHSQRKKKDAKTKEAVSDRMEFHEFMAALKHIGEQIYPDLNADEAMLKLVQDKILPLEK